jgi:two-component system chemotaxis sensor kinase CheA
MKQLLMLPVSSLVEAFPAMVREISMDQQKDIEFVVQGSELEIDKRVLEELKGPLIHLIRNSIDHGIGTSQERMMHNKPPRGTISLVFSAKENGLFEITVSDDGKGIDVEKVLKAAVKSGIVQDDSVMDLNQDEILSLIFHSGLSTSSIITDLSGRGLGLSIVQEKVENLNGRLSMETKEGAGTTFHLILPLTLATFRGIMISLGDHFFIMPTLNVECVQRIEYKQIATIENRDTIRIGDNILALVSMAEVLGLPQPVQTRRGTPPKGVPVSSQIKVVVLVSGQTRIAFKVDEVVEEQQVLVKGLGKLLKRVRNISGATILGSGKIVPVIHVADLMKSAARGIGLQKPEIKEDAPIRNTGRILVAEDSITSRTLLKNILETAGYQVVTAIDGAAAYTRARSEEFDLILSDVDMPRMNGFELTVKVKSDTRLRDIPVVLVTSLESRDDKERGIEAGADAYIVKSSFDQGNLLEVIRKLI